MERMTWNDLPELVRSLVDVVAGRVLKADTVHHGTNAHLTAVLSTTHGRVFCKGTRSHVGGPSVNRFEVAVNPHLPREIVPKLYWQVTAAGWDLIGFELVEGRHADLSPGSPDLQPVLDTLAELAERMTPWRSPLRPLSERWSRGAGWSTLGDDPGLVPWARENLALLAKWEARIPDLLGGETLTHTDLNSQNLLVGDRVSVVDWAWPTRGPRWSDVAFLVPQFILWGHNSGEAEQRAATVPMFADADEDAVTAFAVGAAAVGERLRRENPTAFTEVARARLAWTRHRLAP